MCPIGQMPIVSEEQKDSSNPLIPGPSLPFIVAVVYSETKTQSLNFSKLLRGKILEPGPVHIRIYNIDKIMSIPIPRAIPGSEGQSEVQLEVGANKFS